MYNLSKRRGKAKVKISEKRNNAMHRLVDSYSEDIDVKMSVIQELIPIGLRAVEEELMNEVRRLSGAKHSRDGNNVRWGRQNGSIYLRDQKVPVIVPRVRDVNRNLEVPLETYRRLQRPHNEDATMRRLLHGLSTHKYNENSSLAAEVFGISASNLSKKFKKCSENHLKRLQTRSLAQYDIVAIFIDAKRYADDGIMIGLGVTIEGKKVVLGIEQIHSENSRAIEQWLDGLIERGLRFEDGILFIIDGSKGIRKAVERRFHDYALIQRCQWHKRENVVAYLDEANKEVYRRRLQEAYRKTTYKEAKTALMQAHGDIERLNASAANSLMEGFEETLAVHRLGLSTELSKSLGTTNCIESLMSQVGSYTDKVDRWHNGNQVMRWVGMSAVDIEPRLHRIKGHGYLKVLRYKLREMIDKRSNESQGARETRKEEPLPVQTV